MGRRAFDGFGPTLCMLSPTYYSHMQAIRERRQGSPPVTQRASLLHLGPLSPSTDVQYFQLALALENCSLFWTLSETQWGAMCAECWEQEEMLLLPTPYLWNSFSWMTAQVLRLESFQEHCWPIHFGCAPRQPEDVSNYFWRLFIFIFHYFYLILCYSS